MATTEEEEETMARTKQTARGEGAGTLMTLRSRKNLLPALPTNDTARPIVLDLVNQQEENEDKQEENEDEISRNEDKNVDNELDNLSNEVKGSAVQKLSNDVSGLNVGNKHINHNLTEDSDSSTDNNDDDDENAINQVTGNEFVNIENEEDINLDQIDNDEEQVEITSNKGNQELNLDCDSDL